MKRIVLFFLAFCLYAGSSAQNITAVEYFFDTDPGAGSGTAVSITAATTINKSFDVSITSVSDGFHTLSVRAKDANNKWSTTFTSPFYKLSAAALAAAPNITKLEYFIDADLSAGLGTNVPITAGTSISGLQVLVPLTSVADGFHTLTFRARDASGKWSTAFTSPFYKLPAASLAAAPNITKLEYFIDADLSAGLGTDVPITAGTSISGLQVLVPLTSVADGFHTLTFRARDASGKWSTAFTSPFYKLPAASLAAAPNITRLEFFFDDDAGPGSTVVNNKSVTITPGTSLSLVDLSVDVSSLSTGTHKISFRALDANGKWSIVHISTFGVFGPAPVAQPTTLSFSSITTTSYTVSFTAASPVPDGGYIAIRKAGSAPTADPVDGTTYTKGNTLGDGIVAYAGTASTFNETVLLSGTQYFYKIYAYNGSSTLTNYLTTNPLQGNTTTLADPVQITLEAFPFTFDKGSSMTTSITVNSASKASSVVLKYKGISAPSTAEKNVTVTNVGNKFEKIIAASDLTDPIGIKYYFEVTDKNQSVIKSNTGKAYVRYPASSDEQAIPLLSFGDKPSNYQLISVPLVLSNKNVNTVFSSLGSYDNTLWRLFDYFNNDNREYSGFSTIEPGKGYWLIARLNTNINPGEGTAVPVDETTPFTITLVPGWNLIGNPYNFRISWADVLTASANPAGVATAITIFNSGTLSDAAVLDRYRGGFIQNTTTSDILLKVPVLRNTTLGGGRISGEEINLENSDWNIPIVVSNGEFTNERGGVGMHPKATLTGTDDFDKVSVPLVDGLSIPELAFASANSNTEFTKEVVPTQDRFTWEFEVRQTGEEIVKLQWPVIEEKRDKKLFLLDLATQRLIDMTKENEITLSSESKSLRVIFGDQNYINQVLEKELPAIGLPYPNPAHAEVKIPIFISESLDNSNVVVRVYNSLGEEVTTLVDDHFRKGYHLLNWKPTEPGGLYVVTMKVGSGEERRVKLIIQ